MRVGIGKAAAKHHVRRGKVLRKSWGGHTPDGDVVLFMWHDQKHEQPDGTLHVNAYDPGDHGQWGGDERLGHIAEIDHGTPAWALLGDRVGRYWEAETLTMTLYRILRVLPPDDNGVRWAVLRAPRLS